ncbi:U4/U6-U5 snRNP complex subunit dib1 [Hanseniaspora vineae]
MGSVFLPHLHSGWHVDQAILHDQDRLVLVRFGRPQEKECMIIDEVLFQVAEKVRNFAAIYLCDIDEVPDFNDMYNLHDDPVTIMFFWRNKHMVCDFGTGENNKMDFSIDDEQEMIDIIETIYRGARKGRGAVNSPYDYNYKRKR